MKRNKDGVLVFNSPQERKEYENKRKEFLSRTEEENIRLYNQAAAENCGTILELKWN